MKTIDNTTETIATLRLAAQAVSPDATTMARLDAVATLEPPARHNALAELWDQGGESALAGDWPAIVLAELDLAGGNR